VKQVNDDGSPLLKATVPPSGSTIYIPLANVVAMTVHPRLPEAMIFMPYGLNVQIKEGERSTIEAMVRRLARFHRKEIIVDDIIGGCFGND